MDFLEALNKSGRFFGIYLSNHDSDNDDAILVSHHVLV